MEFTKDMIGSVIYALGTGNNARGAHGGKLRTFKVIAILRKYVELQPYDESSGAQFKSDKYCPETGATQFAINSGYRSNSGYKFFKTIEDFQDYSKRLEIVKVLRDNFNAYSIDATLGKMTTKQLLAIRAIIDEVEGR
jgi:hypothetical protein